MAARKALPLRLRSSAHRLKRVQIRYIAMDTGAIEIDAQTRARVCTHTHACACARTRVHTKWIRAGRWVAHLRERRISVDSDDAAHGQRVARKLRHELAGRGHPQLDLPVGPAAHDLHREAQWLPSGAATIGER